MTAEEKLTTKMALVRLRQYRERTSTWSTATYDSGTERALHQIATALGAAAARVPELERLLAAARDQVGAEQDAQQALRARIRRLEVTSERLAAERDRLQQALEQAGRRARPRVVRWDRTVTAPDSDGDVLVCCLDEAGRPVGLLLDEELREALGLLLLDRDPDEGDCAGVCLECGMPPREWCLECRTCWCGPHESDCGRRCEDGVIHRRLDDGAERSDRCPVHTRGGGRRG